ncbi:hypothetical protein VTO42DRAFT_994 [Malbranchea cinnamomea]
MPCHCSSKAPSSGERDPIPNNKECCPSHRNCCKEEQSGALAKLSGVSPFFSALLSCSCCWLPALLDFLSVGSASVTILERFRPIFLLITIGLLSWDLHKRGFTQRTVKRIIISGILLIWPQLLDLLRKEGAAQPVAHKCH